MHSFTITLEAIKTGHNYEKETYQSSVLCALHQDHWTVGAPGTPRYSKAVNQKHLLQNMIAHALTGINKQHDGWPSAQTHTLRVTMAKDCGEYSESCAHEFCYLEEVSPDSLLVALAEEVSILELA